MIYYVSDLHIGHNNAIRFDNRPFADINEMECEIISRWNKKVNSDDDVYILGDIFYHYKKDKAEFLQKLNGKLHLIVGNHDYEMLNTGAALDCFETVDNLKRTIDDGRMVIVCHFPITSWNMKHHGAYHVYGHVHSKINEETLFMMKQERAFNAGCMINNYEPCTLEELEKNNMLFSEAAFRSNSDNEI